MKVVIAMDSFKGSISSICGGNAVKKGVLSVYPQANVIVKPLADGGEGTVDALVEGTNGHLVTRMVTGPIGEKVLAAYGILGDRKIAVIEMATAAGLPLLSTEQRNPLQTTTYGVGELIRHGIEEGCREFIIGLGGSATNDGGIGMLQALGFHFYDDNNQEVGFGGEVLARITSIHSADVMRELEECVFHVACDVDNPLYGENGAAYVYGPQKGATKEMVEELDQGLRHYATVVKRELGMDINGIPGVGAAGGLGAAFLLLPQSELKSGIHIVMEILRLEEAMIDADFVITGEGQLDFQTAMGKAPIGVAHLANKQGAKVIALAGAVTRDAVKVNEAGIHSFFSVTNGAMSLEDAMKRENVEQNLEGTTRQIFNLIKSLSVSSLT